MHAIDSFIFELWLTVRDPAVLVHVGVALCFALACLVLGGLAGRLTGMTNDATGTADRLVVGLALGMMILASTWATVASRGQSSFTIVALGFASAIAYGAAKRRFSPPRSTRERGDGAVTEPRRNDRRRRDLILGLVAAGAFIAGVALVFGSSLQQRPRDDLQPIESVDEAYYAVLGRDLSTQGIESMYGPSGFEHFDDLPRQNWYHWGEIWLASTLISVLGIDPLAARNLIVLPVVLLACAGLSGVIVRRFVRTTSSRPFIFGFVACLFLAPLPFPPGPFFAQWAVGMVFSVTQYGLGAVATLLALAMLLGSPRRGRGAHELATSSSLAFVLPAHLALALLVALGVAVVALVNIRYLLSASARELGSAWWARAIGLAGALGLATIAWGVITGHGVGSSAAAQGVQPFNETWVISIAAVLAGSGVMLALPAAGFVGRRRDELRRNIVIGTLAILAGGGIVWGARLPDFNMFHLFFGGLIVIGVPVAAAGIWLVGQRLRETGRLTTRKLLFVAVILQLEVGLIYTLDRLQGFGPGRYDPVPVAVLAAIRDLPADAKVAYACQPFEEFGFAGPALGAINAHTGRPLVPMCYQADFIRTLIGADPDPGVANPFFRWAPQQVIFPDPSVVPEGEAVEAFMRRHGIGYLYVDELHTHDFPLDVSLVIGVDGYAVYQLRPE